MKIINDTRRKTIRYLLFAKKNKIKLKKSILGKKEDAEIINFFENSKEFTNWDEFEVKWDIGIGDDMVAQSNRQEKWFLFNKEKSQIIKRPNDYWEKEAERRKTSTHALFLQECHHRGISMEELFKLFF